MVDKILLSLMLLAISPIALAHEYTCTHSGLTRIISVIHPDDSPLPCQVKYEKTSERDVQYPWEATNTMGYCEAKADYLAQRLESFGWQCDRAREPQEEAHSTVAH